MLRMSDLLSFQGRVNLEVTWINLSKNATLFSRKEDTGGPVNQERLQYRD